MKIYPVILSGGAGTRLWPLVARGAAEAVVAAGIGPHHVAGNRAAPA
jgi:imidazole glycerol phosphate synthase subunit HisF